MIKELLQQVLKEKKKSLDVSEGSILHDALILPISNLLEKEIGEDNISDLVLKKIFSGVENLDENEIEKCLSEKFLNFKNEYAGTVEAYLYFDQPIDGIIPKSAKFHYGDAEFSLFDDFMISSNNFISEGVNYKYRFPLTLNNQNKVNVPENSIGLLNYDLPHLVTVAHPKIIGKVAEMSLNEKRELLRGSVRPQNTDRGLRSNYLFKSCPFLSKVTVVRPGDPEMKRDAVYNIRDTYSFARKTYEGKERGDSSSSAIYFNVFSDVEKDDPISFSYSSSMEISQSDYLKIISENKLIDRETGFLFQEDFIENSSEWKEVEHGFASSVYRPALVIDGALKFGGDKDKLKSEIIKPIIEQVGVSVFENAIKKSVIVENNDPRDEIIVKLEKALSELKGEMNEI